MKRNLLFIFPFLLLFLIACSETEEMQKPNLPDTGKLINLSSSEYVSIAFDNPRELAEAEVVSIADNFLKAKDEVSNKSTANTKQGLSSNVKIKSKYYIGKDHSASTVKTKSSDNENKANNILMYDIQIDQDGDEGLIVVSGDERASKVIAYIPKVDKTNENFSSEYMLAVSKRSLLDNIEDIEKMKDSLRTSTLEKIGIQLGIENVQFDEVKDYLSVNYESLSKATPVQIPPTVVLSYVENMCKTQWDQLRPYYNKMPIGNTTHGNNQNYPAGCGVVMCAQIIAALEPNLTCNGIKMDWTYLKERPSIYELIGPFPLPGITYDENRKLEMISALIRNVYDLTGSGPQYSNNIITGVGTTYAQCESYIKRYANASSIVGYNPDQIRNSLLAHRPVAALGFGYKQNGNKSEHGFILDGYLMCQMYTGTRSMMIESDTKELVKIYDLYFHANFGWDGKGDGYYLINKDTSVTFETKTNENVVYKSGDFKYITDIRLK